MRKSILILVVIVITAMPAAAKDRGLYIGGSIGGSSLEVRDFDDELGDLRFSKGDTAYKLFAGYRFLSFLGVEAGYVDLGSPNDTVGIVDETDVEVEIGVKGWDAFAIGILPIGPVDLFAKLGVVSWDADIRASFGDLVDRDSDSGTDTAYGLGLALRLGSFAVRIEGEQFDIGDADDVYLYTVGVTYTF